MTGSEIGGVVSEARCGEYLMTKAVEKITLFPSQEIPYERLLPSESNVRRVKAGVLVEELAADIARCSLLQSLSVRLMLDGMGNETDMFEIPAGGRRFQAVLLLVKQKSSAKETEIPCIVRETGSDIFAEDDPLAENMLRVTLHPLDQFQAFVSLCENGQGNKEIATAYFVTQQVVKKR